MYTFRMLLILFPKAHHLRATEGVRGNTYPSEGATVREAKKRGVLGRVWYRFLLFPLMGEVGDLAEEIRVRVARQRWAFLCLSLSAVCASLLFAATPGLRPVARGLPGLPLGLSKEQTDLLSDLLGDAPWLQLLILPYGLAMAFSGYARWSALGAWNESDVVRKQWYGRVGTMLAIAITIAIYATAYSRTTQFHGWVSALPGLAALSLLLSHRATPWQDLKAHAAEYGKSLRARIAEYRQGCTLLKAYASSYPLGIPQDRIGKVQSQLDADTHLLGLEGRGRGTPEDVPVLEILEKDWAPLAGAFGMLPLLVRREAEQELELAEKLANEIAVLGAPEEQRTARDLARRLTRHKEALATDAATDIARVLNVVQARQSIKDALDDLADLFRDSVLARPKVVLDRLTELYQSRESGTTESLREAVPEGLRSRVESLAAAMPDRPQPDELERLVEEARSVFEEVRGLSVLAQQGAEQELGLAKKMVTEIESLGAPEEQRKARELAHRLTHCQDGLAADAVTDIAQVLSVVQERESIKHALDDVADLFRASVLARPKALLERLKGVCQGLESQTGLSLREAVSEGVRSRAESLAGAMPARPQADEVGHLVEEARLVSKEVTGLFVPTLRQIVDASRALCQGLDRNLKRAQQLLGRATAFQDIAKSQQGVAAAATELAEMEKTLGRDTLSEASVTQLVERLHNLLANLSDAETLLSNRVKEEEDKARQAVGSYGHFQDVARVLPLDGADGEQFQEWLERRHKLDWRGLAHQVLLHAVEDPDIAELLS